MDLQVKIRHYLEDYGGTIKRSTLIGRLFQDLKSDSKYARMGDFQKKEIVETTISEAIRNKTIAIKLYEEFTPEEKAEDDVYYKLL